MSAWASEQRLASSEQRLALGQVATVEKSNESTAIPALLEQQSHIPGANRLEATGDYDRRQGGLKEIAEKIDAGKTTCVLAVKPINPRRRDR